MQAVLFDVHEAELVGSDFMIRSFAEAAVDIEVGLCDLPSLEIGLICHSYLFSVLWLRYIFLF